MKEPTAWAAPSTNATARAISALALLALSACAGRQPAPRALPLSSPDSFDMGAPVTALAASPDGTRLAIGAGDHLVLRPAHGNAPALTLASGPVADVAFSREGARVVVAAADRPALRVYAAADGALVREITVPFRPREQRSRTVAGPDHAIAVAFGPDSYSVVALTSEEMLRTFDGTGAPVTAVEAAGLFLVSPDHATVVSRGTTWSTVVRVQLPSGVKLDDLRPTTMDESVDGAAYSPDGRWLALGQATGHVLVIDAATGAKRWEADQRSRQVAYSPDGRVVASALEHGDVSLYDAATGAPLRTLRGHATPVHSLAFVGGGSTLVTLGVSVAWVPFVDPRASLGPTVGLPGDERDVRVWDVSRGAESVQLTNPGGGPHHLAPLPNGFAWAQQSAVSVWTIGQPGPRMPAHGGSWIR